LSCEISSTSSPTLCLYNISALPRTMSQLQALQKLYVGINELQYSDVQFIIESFPQLTELGIDYLGLTGQFSFRKSRTSCHSSSVLTHMSVLPESIGQLLSLESLDCGGNEIAGTIFFSPTRTSTTFGLSAISVCVCRCREAAREDRTPELCQSGHLAGPQPRGYPGTKGRGRGGGGDLAGAADASTRQSEPVHW
jgi:hypothetical protein